MVGERGFQAPTPLVPNEILMLVGKCENLRLYEPLGHKGTLHDPEHRALEHRRRYREKKLAYDLLSCT